MNRDKQIEEMDCEKCLHYEACQIAFRNAKALSIYEDDYNEEQYFADTIDCDYYVNKNDYRKASEVAREIFEEIEDLFKRYRIDMNSYYNIGLREKLAELKKKYKEEGK